MKYVKKGISILLFIVTATGIVWSAHAMAAEGVYVKYHTQKEIRDYIENSGVSLNENVSFEKEPAIATPYSLGKLSDKSLISALKMLNQIRFIAGISDNVTLSSTYNELSQAASLANYLDGSLSHYPTQPEGMSDEMYALAYRGASSSNLYYSNRSDSLSLNRAIVSSWMADSDSTNITRVGHRWWCLNPSMRNTGFGAVIGPKGTYSAMYALDQSNVNAEEYGVMWPAQNMPLEYFNVNFPWSVSMSYEVDISTVKIVLKREQDGKKWEFSQTKADGDFYVHNNICGQKGCIIFRPDITEINKYKDGDIFHVEINGLPQGNISYSVNFFALGLNADQTVSDDTGNSSSDTIRKFTYQEKNGLLLGFSLKSNTLLEVLNQFFINVLCVDTNRKFVSTGDALVGTGYVFYVPDGTDYPEHWTAVLAGDIYGDGKIDSKDVSYLARYRLVKESLSDAQLEAADVYEDGKVDSKDVSKLARYRLGKDTISSQ